MTPCPFCGGEPVLDAEGGGEQFWMRCRSCAAVGPWAKSEGAARGAWSRRVPDADAENAALLKKLDDATEAATDAAIEAERLRAENAALRDVLDNLSEFASSLTFALAESDKVHQEHFAACVDGWVANAHALLHPAAPPATGRLTVDVSFLQGDRGGVVVVGDVVVNVMEDDAGVVVVDVANGVDPDGSATPVHLRTDGVVPAVSRSPR